MPRREAYPLGTKTFKLYVTDYCGLYPPPTCRHTHTCEHPTVCAATNEIHHTHPRRANSPALSTAPKLLPCGAVSTNAKVDFRVSCVSLPNDRTDPRRETGDDSATADMSELLEPPRPDN